MWRRIVKLVRVDGKLLAGGDRTRQQRKAVCARKGGNVVAAHTRTRRWACGNGFRHGDGARLNERVVRFGEVRTGDGREARPVLDTRGAGQSAQRAQQLGEVEVCGDKRRHRVARQTHHGDTVPERMALRRAGPLVDVAEPVIIAFHGILDHSADYVESASGHATGGDNEIGIRSGSIEAPVQLNGGISTGRAGDLAETGGRNEGFEHGPIRIGKLAVEQLLTRGNDGHSWDAVNHGGVYTGGEGGGDKGGVDKRGRTGELVAGADVGAAPPDMVMVGQVVHRDGFRHRSGPRGHIGVFYWNDQAIKPLRNLPASHDSHRGPRLRDLSG